MSNNPSRLNIFIADLKRRKVTRLITIYAVVGLGMIEAIDVIGGRFLLPEWSIKLVIGIVLGGFPITVILSWIFDLTKKGIERTKALTPEQESSLPPFTWRPSWFSLILFLLLIALLVTFCAAPRPNALGFKKQDWILICDIENYTGKELYDKSLVHAVSITIDQSRYVSVYPREQVLGVLQRMRIDSPTNINIPIALEIAERENVKAVLALAISELGDTYLLSMRLLNPSTGQTIRSHKEIAKRDRQKRGEDSCSIRKVSL